MRRDGRLGFWEGLRAIIAYLWTWIRGGHYLIPLVLVLTLGATGCASKEAFQAWEKVETSRATAWEKVHTEKAKHPPVSRVMLKPSPGEKTVTFNGTLVVEIAHPEGRSTTQLPPVSKRPATSGEVAAKMFRNPLGQIMNGVLGFKAIEEGADVLKEGFKAKGVKIKTGDRATIGADGSTVNGPTRKLTVTGDQNQAGMTEGDQTFTNSPRRDTDNPVTN